MRNLLVAAILLSSSLASAQAKHAFAGSDTLAGPMTDAIIAAGMDQQLQYAGGGSGTGEKGLLNGDQGIAPMSREIAPAAVQQLTAQNVKVVPHVIGLDGLSVFVKGNNSLSSIDIPTIVRIFNCEFTQWEQIPGSGMKGAIKVYRRNDNSGTTDAFKHFTGVKKFGACVTALAETADIADVTSRDVMALGYSGLSAKTEQNRALAVAAKAGAPAVLPTTGTIRNETYPMARRLYVYEVKGARKANQVEQDFLSYVTDRSFMDPIMQAHEFITQK